MTGTKFWIVTHHHRFGTSCWPFRHEPDLEDSELHEQCDFEPDREDEWLEIHGPFKTADLV